MIIDMREHVDINVLKIFIQMKIQCHDLKILMYQLLLPLLQMIRLTNHGKWLSKNYIKILILYTPNLKLEDI